MKKILAVYDADEEYGKRLSEYLNRRESIPFRTVCFTKEDALYAYRKDHPIDLLLMSESCYHDDMSKIAESGVFYLTDVPAKAMQETYIYKYKSADSMVKEITSRYQALHAPADDSAVEFCSLIGIYSPVSRCLKSSFALTLGQLLSKSDPVLYLNLEEFSALSFLMNRDFENDLSKAVFYYSHDQLSQKLGELTESWNSLDYIPPVRYPEDLYNLDPDLAAGMVLSIRNMSLYRYILLDFSSTARFLEKLLPEFSCLFMPVLNDPISECKCREFEAWIRMRNQASILEKVHAIRLPFHRSFSDGTMYLDQLIWGELGDTVRELIRTYLHSINKEASKLHEAVPL